MHLSVFEAAMLICFGISWPVSIHKALRTRRVEGKSPLFMTIVAIGYGCGILHKIFYALDPILALYVFNLTMVLIDLGLYYRFAVRTPA